MKKERNTKIIYYKDELNDDFANTNIQQKSLPKNFKYGNNNIFYKIGEFIIYYLVAFPIVHIFEALSGVRIYNRKILKQSNKSGYYLYLNHTALAHDAFNPTVITGIKKKPMIIVSREATSIKGIRTLVMWLGALPLPDSKENYRNYISKLDELNKNNKVIAIYPEAHIWPYYTHIRPFKSDSFIYPVKYHKPVYSVTTVYKKRKIGKKPRKEVYIDGPFMPDINLSIINAKKELRDKVFEAMNERSELNNIEYYKYIKID